MLFGRLKRNKQEKKKLLGYIVKAIEVYAIDCANGIIQEVQMLEANSTDDIDYNALLEKHAKSYFKNVEHAVLTVYRDQPNVYENIMHVMRNAHLCGLEDISDDEVIMAGRVYAICLYALLGEEADPGMCIALNHTEHDTMMDEILKRGSNTLTK